MKSKISKLMKSIVRKKEKYVLMVTVGIMCILLIGTLYYSKELDISLLEATKQPIATIFWTLCVLAMTVASGCVSEKKKVIGSYTLDKLFTLVSLFIIEFEVVMNWYSKISIDTIILTAAIMALVKTFIPLYDFINEYQVDGEGIARKMNNYLSKKCPNKFTCSSKGQTVYIQHELNTNICLIVDRNTEKIKLSNLQLSGLGDEEIYTEILQYYVDKSCKDIEIIRDSGVHIKTIEYVD